MLRTIAIITTLRCDLKCAHCLRDYPKQRPDFPMQLLPRLLMEAKAFGTKHIALTGGEPHLHPQFDQIADMVVSAGYTWSFVSHGGRTAPYEALLNKFGESLTHMSLSIDGATAEVHDDIRRKAGAFQRVTSAARHYRALGFKVKMSTSLNKVNKHQLPEIIALARDLEVNHLMLGGTIPTPWNEDLQLTDAENDELYQAIAKFQSETRDLRITHFSSLHTRGGVNFCDILNMGELTFNARGELMFCCDTHSHGAIIGSLAHQPFGELVKTWLNQANILQQHRANLLMTGDLEAGFNTCTFCNRYFLEEEPRIARG